VDRKVKVETVGALAAAELLAVVRSGTCVDSYLQDQLVIFLGLAEGTSRVLMGEPTSHTRTAVALVERLTAAKFALSEVEAPGAGAAGEARPPLWLLECCGAGAVVDPKLDS
jgi:RNA 3'-terminal phosphate cyclase (ATP)